MKRNHRELDELIDEITVDAYGEEEQMGAFLEALEDNVSFPCTATVIGVPIQITKFDYVGNDRHGLTAKCRRADGTSHIVGVADLVIASDSPCEKYLAAYCKWMGVERRSASPRPRKSASKRATKTSPQRAGLPPAPGDDQVELAVLAVMQKAAHCRFLNGDATVTLRAGRLWDIVRSIVLHLDAGIEVITARAGTIGVCPMPCLRMFAHLCRRTPCLKSSARPDPPATSCTRPFHA